MVLSRNAARRNSRIARGREVTSPPRIAPHEEQRFPAQPPREQRNLSQPDAAGYNSRGTLVRPRREIRGIGAFRRQCLASRTVWVHYSIKRPQQSLHGRNSSRRFDHGVLPPRRFNDCAASRASSIGAGASLAPCLGRRAGDPPKLSQISGSGRD